MFRRSETWPGTDMPEDYFIVLDLGQAKDFTAVAIVEGLVYHDHYRCVYLERMRGISYPKIIQKIEDLVHSEPICWGNLHLVVDKTGVGAPVVDAMFEKNLNPVGITITGGDKPVCTYLNEWKTRQAWTCPKRDLVHNLLLMAQSKKLTILDHLRDAQVLLTEMQNMRSKIDIKRGNDSYSAWRESDHDDLVLALALAAWWTLKRPVPTYVTTPRRA